MRWKQYAHDPAKARALADILLDAATADAPLDEDELVDIEALLLKVLGVAELEPELKAHVEGFDPKTHDLELSVVTLGLETEHDKHELVRAVAAVIAADHRVERVERAFTFELAARIGLPLADVIHLIGLPQRPMTGPRPRPILIGGPGSPREAA